MGQFDGFVKRSNVFTEHSHDAAEIGFNPSALFRFIETSKLSFDLSSIFYGGRTLGFQELESGIHVDHLFKWDAKCSVISCTLDRLSCIRLIRTVPRR